MEKNLYKEKKNELILRDELALDRTHLANERTVLAYFRTGLTCFLIGISLIKLFESKTFQIMGFFFLGMAVLITIVGFVRYFKMNKKLKKIKN